MRTVWYARRQGRPSVANWRGILSPACWDCQDWQTQPPWRNAIVDSTRPRPYVGLDPYSLIKTGLEMASKLWNGAVMPIKTKRWNDPKEADDGYRLLICQYRPRPLPKSKQTSAGWCKL